MNPSSTNPANDVVFTGARAASRPKANRAGLRQQIPLKRMHLVWPEKVGLVTALAVAVMSALVCATVLFAADTMSFGKLNHALALWSGVAELIIALPIWLIMRAIDFAANGPAHRRANRNFRAV